MSRARFRFTACTHRLLGTCWSSHLSSSSVTYTFALDGSSLGFLRFGTETIGRILFFLHHRSTVQRTLLTFVGVRCVEFPETKKPMSR